MPWDKRNQNAHIYRYCFRSLFNEYEWISNNKFWCQFIAEYGEANWFESSLSDKLLPSTNNLIQFNSLDANTTTGKTQPSAQMSCVLLIYDPHLRWALSRAHIGENSFSCFSTSRSSHIHRIEMLTFPHSFCREPSFQAYATRTW